MIFYSSILTSSSFPGGSDGKESACNSEDPGLVPGEGNDYPLQYSQLENSLDRGAWWATVHGVTKSQTQLKQLSTHAQSSAGVGVMWVK